MGFGTPVGEKMKQRQTKVEETDLWGNNHQSRGTKQSLATHPPLRSRLMPMVLVQAQGYTTVSTTHALAFQSERVSSVYPNSSTGHGIKN